MKSLIITGILGTVSCLSAQEKPVAPKEVKPFVFFKHHTRPDYSYRLSGVGIELSKTFKNNMKIGGHFCSAYEKESVFSEDQLFVSYLFDYSDIFSFGGEIKTESTHHLLFKNKENRDYDIIVSSMRVKTGPIICLNFFDASSLNISGSLVQDIYSTVSVRRKDQFWGQIHKKYQAFNIGLAYDLNNLDNHKIGLKFNYEKTFKNYYSTYTTELQYSWII